MYIYIYVYTNIILYIYTVYIYRCIYLGGDIFYKPRLWIADMLLVQPIK